MAYITDQLSNTGSFVGSTSVWDVSALWEVDVNSPEFKELLVRLYQNINNISIALNSKDTAYYLTSEINSGQQYFSTTDASNSLLLRPGFRTLVNVGAVGAGVTTVAHGLAVTSSWKWVSIAGAGTDSVNVLGYPFTFGGAAGNSIELHVTATNVVINNQSGVTFTDCYIVLEYVKL